MPLTLPSGLTYQAGRFRYMSNAQRFVSPISRVGQSVGRVGDFWGATLTLPPIRDTQAAAEWGAFAAKIAGGLNSFYLYPPLQSVHTINGASTPRVNGASQSGTTLNLDGFTPGDVLRVGGFIAYDTSTFRMLHILQATATANGSGQIAATVLPAIRKSPADNATVITVNPSCEMVVEGSDADVLTLTDAVWYGHTFNCVEDVRE